MAGGSFGGGNGTAEKPWLVEDAADLNAVRNNLAACYKQTADIDLESYGNWTPIGSQDVFPDAETIFTGSYDGDGFSIDNCTVRSGDGGLFTWAGHWSDEVIIKNVTLNNVDVSVDSQAGGICSRFEAGLMENCHVNGTIISDTSNAGGIASQNFGVMVKCSSSGYVEGGLNVGGLIGACAAGSFTRQCFSTAIVVAYNRDPWGSSAAAGGLVGLSESATVENCYAAGNATIEKKGYAAGFIGCITRGSYINNYSLGESLRIDETSTRPEIVTIVFTSGISANGWVRIQFTVLGYSVTIVFQAEATAEQVVSAFAGVDYNGWIASGSGNTLILTGDKDEERQNVVVTGQAITFTVNIQKGLGANLGGFVGRANYLDQIVDANNYWDMETSKTERSAIASPKTTAEMKQRPTFVDWDFNEFWDITTSINDGYPYLQSRPGPSRMKYELIFGPVTFGISHLEKRVRKVSLVVSKEPDAVMLVSTSASDVGDFAFEKEVAAGQGLDMRKIYLPMAQGNPSGGLAYRVRIRGIGRVQIHDISFDVSVRRAW